ncbi:MAG: ABC transporter substrate-binding protein [Candidatus Deferrimicrobiaceae bacterium]|jgi:phospholipid transport system substrate-binding protein
MNIKTIGSVLILMSFGMTHLAYGAQPLDELKGPIEQVINILRDPQYKDAAKKDLQREKMWEIARKIFDFEAIARGTLTRFRWDGFTPRQREEFTDVFTEFIGNNYFNKIQGEYHNEEVVFLKQEMFTESKARVMTKIRRESIEIPVDYSMWVRNDRWKIFNVYIEGVSLLGNYRNEFERFLTNSSIGDLISELKKKVDRQKKGETVEKQ